MKFLILLLLVVPFLINDAYGQTIINVTATDPCFLNYTAGVDMWRNCGFDTDFIKAALAPFEWVTGGLFSMIVVGVLCLMTWLKYHTIIYPVIIGVVMLPMSYFLIPAAFLNFVFLMVVIAFGAIIWSIVVQRTNSN